MNLDIFLSKLSWRYATKIFDRSKKIAPELFKKLLEVPRLSPSSYGLQPWKFVVVNNPELRSELRKHAWNQPQITDASHLIVLCTKSEMTKEDINSHADTIAHTRGQKLEEVEGYRQMMLGTFPSMQGEPGKHWMTHQVYIALGMLLAACAIEEIDACPMEGFDKDAFTKILNLSELGVEAKVLCAMGYRSGNDKLASAKKVRKAHEQVVVTM